MVVHVFCLYYKRSIDLNMFDGIQEIDQFIGEHSTKSCVMLKKINKMIHKIVNTSHSNLTDWGLVILRLSVGALMITHGWSKLMNFDAIVSDGNFIPILGSVSLGLGLTVMAEFFMSLLIMAGLLTRISVIPLIIAMLVAAFVAHANQPLSEKEHALLFLFPYITILLSGAGRFSVDYYLSKRFRN